MEITLKVLSYNSKILGFVLHKRVSLFSKIMFMYSHALHMLTRKCPVSLSDPLTIPFLKYFLYLE